MNAGVFPRTRCRSQCWFAQGNTCRCACGGESHGAMSPNGKRANTKSLGRKNLNGKSLGDKNRNGKSRRRRGGMEFQMLLWSTDTGPEEDSSGAEPQRATQPAS